MAYALDNPMVIIGMAALGLYSLLLQAGGLIGFLKAKSRPSLIAGMTSGLIGLISLVMILLGWGREGFLVALVLSGLMSLTFFIRYRKTGKLMPSGMLAGLSVAMFVLLAVILLRFR